jgi:mannose-1-phosphate guanylyltransferase
MAGGSGTRFWPESRQARPKQLLRLVGERTLLEATVDRLGTLVEPGRTMILTAAPLVDEVRRQVPQLPAGAVLGEPCGRDTAPCIGLAALLMLRADPDAVMAVMPADHVIEPPAAFQEAISLACALVAASQNRIVTFGIRPTYPAESFGYIERGAPLDVLDYHSANGEQPAVIVTVEGGDAAASHPVVFHVKQFREKPSADVARQYLAAGNFYWNSGIFVWRASTIVRELEARQPEMVKRLKAIAATAGTKDFDATFAREFPAIQAISIDYAVMEHARDVLVIEAPFRWDDVGSWQAMARLEGSDSEGNTISARHLGLKTTGTIVRGPLDHLIVTLGVSDLIVVHTPDATLVASKHDEEAIRQLVKMIADRGWREYL